MLTSLASWKSWESGQQTKSTRTEIPTKSCINDKVRTNPLASVLVSPFCVSMETFVAINHIQGLFFPLQITQQSTLQMEKLRKITLDEWDFQRSAIFGTLDLKMNVYRVAKSLLANFSPGREKNTAITPWLARRTSWKIFAVRLASLFSYLSSKLHRFPHSIFSLRPHLCPSIYLVLELVFLLRVPV